MERRGARGHLRVALPNRDGGIPVHALVDAVGTGLDERDARRLGIHRETLVGVQLTHAHAHGPVVQADLHRLVVERFDGDRRIRRQADRGRPDVRLGPG